MYADAREPVSIPTLASHPRGKPAYVVDSPGDLRSVHDNLSRSFELAGSQRGRSLRYVHPRIGELKTNPVCPLRRRHVASASGGFRMPSNHLDGDDVTRIL